MPSFGGPRVISVVLGGIALMLITNEHAGTSTGQRADSFHVLAQEYGGKLAPRKRVADVRLRLGHAGRRQLLDKLMIGDRPAFILKTACRRDAP